MAGRKGWFKKVSMISNSMKHWRKRALGVTWPRLRPKARQSAAPDQSSCSATLPCDGKASLSQGDTSQCLGNRDLFPGVHPNYNVWPWALVIYHLHCWREQPRLLSCSLQIPWIIFFSPLTDPFHLPSISVDMEHPKLTQHSSCALSDEEKDEDLPPAGNSLSHRCDSPPWLWEQPLAHRTWHWVQTSPACSRSLASRGEPNPAGRQQLSHSEAVLGGPSNDTRCEARWGGSEPLHTARKVQSPLSNPDVVIQP